MRVSRRQQPILSVTIVGIVLILSTRKCEINHLNVIRSCLAFYKLSTEILFSVVMMLNKTFIIGSSIGLGLVVKYILKR